MKDSIARVISVIGVALVLTSCAGGSTKVFSLDNMADKLEREEALVLNPLRFNGEQMPVGAWRRKFTEARGKCTPVANVIDGITLMFLVDSHNRLQGTELNGAIVCGKAVYGDEGFNVTEVASNLREVGSALPLELTGREIEKISRSMQDTNGLLEQSGGGSFEDVVLRRDGVQVSVIAYPNAMVSGGTRVVMFSADH
jgi:hypothetical protein